MDYPTTGITEFNTINETGTTISSTTSTSVLSARSGRVFARFTNKGQFSIFLGLGKTASKTKGIVIRGYDFYEFNREKLWRGAINGISNTASSNQSLFIEEGYVE